MIGYSFKCDTKYFLQIWSGAQAVKKLRPDFIVGPPAARLLKKSHNLIGKKPQKNPHILVGTTPPLFSNGYLRPR